MWHLSHAKTWLGNLLPCDCFCNGCLHSAVQAQADAAWFAAEQQRREALLSMERDTLAAAEARARQKLAETQAQVSGTYLQTRAPALTPGYSFFDCCAVTFVTISLMAYCPRLKRTAACLTSDKPTQVFLMHHICRSHCTAPKLPSWKGGV